MSMSTTSLFYTGGATIGFDCSIIAFAGYVGTVLAISQAQISKVLFDSYHNIDALAEAFPDRVKILGSIVQIKGPVLISSGFSAYFVPIAIAGVISAAAYFAIKKIASAVWTADSKADKPSSISKALVYVLTGLTFAAAAFVLFQRIPVEPGVHLLDWSFKKIN